MDALQENGTWDVVKLPKGKKATACRWVYKIKQKSDGTIERYKVRLVAKGFTQRHGIDFHETFSPVVKFTTVRSLVAIAVKRNWNIHQFDVNNTFLHGELHEEVYMRLPPGHEASSSPSLVCKLKKSLYGLRQASRQWYAKLSTALRSKGCFHSPNHYSLFLKKSSSSITIVEIYVDDILVTGDDIGEIRCLNEFLHHQIKIKDLGLLHFLLGIEFNKLDHGMMIHQTKFIKQLLQDYDLDDVTPVSSPLPPQVKLLPKMDNPLPDATIYRQLIGKHNFLLHTHPDLAFFVQHLSQFNQIPSQEHYSAAIHILKYIKGTISQALYFNDNKDFKLDAFCDSNCAACPITRKSVSGYYILFGGSPISWKSKKQSTISLSSAKAEYQSMRRVTAKLSWLSRLLDELGVT